MGLPSLRSLNLRSCSSVCGVNIIEEVQVNQREEDSMVGWIVIVGIGFMLFTAILFGGCTLQVAADKRVDLLQDQVKGKAEAAQVDSALRQVSSILGQLNERVGKLEKAAPK